MDEKYTAAKELFDRYDGSSFHMKRDGVDALYKSYQVPRSVEAQWFNEKKEEMIGVFQTCSNPERATRAFERYGQFAARSGDATATDIMIQHIQSKINICDSNTLLRSVSALLSLSQIGTCSQKKEIISKCIEFLEIANSKEITVSDAYLDSADGEIPDYLTKEAIRERLQRKIKYCTELQSKII